MTVMMVTGNAAKIPTSPFNRLVPLPLLLQQKWEIQFVTVLIIMHYCHGDCSSVVYYLDH